MSKPEPDSGSHSGDSPAPQMPWGPGAMPFGYPPPIYFDPSAWAQEPSNGQEVGGDQQQQQQQPWFPWPAQDGSGQWMMPGMMGGEDGGIPPMLFVPPGAFGAAPYWTGDLETAGKKKKKRGGKKDSKAVEDDSQNPDIPKTTLMVRHIPNKYTQRMLLNVCNERGFQGTINFFYLPIDFRNKCNVGYAFVNFTNEEEALRFKTDFEGFKLTHFKSNKVLQISFARIQGYEKNVEHFRNSAVMGGSVAPEYQPLLFDPITNEEIDFPQPDKPIKNVKLRKAKS
mmetsp:Transcript_82359/g.188332  ORF Transcript_82359/g.188332 Transcript_82359/m.188332 type:complete len:283 (+) Transcript_82359:41-889(+)|eukprot:CAMPEP_0204327150 /NCGR_PEP_ID=MMETSP0469-20131031/12365_1 /ASSEMBLY_ACC=CAM_ASM_000384 /TAXON_ID=2969 /ORGANISM="Oxyrrhis marina" /LENGTH=282 /DNA_ID=CAMNT_0051309329 /DNA_START=1 /DNA_END=849 /DNA_ORIENTATION=-